MEQFIILIIFYVLYALFNRFTRKLKNPQPPPQARQRPTSSRPGQSTTTAAPPGKNISEQTLVEEKEPEIELPPFIQEIFGIDKPKPPQEVTPPPAPKEVAPEPIPEKEPEGIESASLETFERIKALKDRRYQKEKKSSEAKTGSSSATSTKRGHLIQSLLKDSQYLKNAFILKEILDTPVSKRQKRNPNLGRL